MAAITKRTDRSGKVAFHVRVRLKGHPVACATFDTKTKAKLWAGQTEREIREGRYFEKAEARRHTLGEAIQRFFSEQPHKHLRTASEVDKKLKWFSDHYGYYLISPPPS